MADEHSVVFGLVLGVVVCAVSGVLEGVDVRRFDAIGCLKLLFE